MPHCPSPPSSPTFRCHHLAIRKLYVILHLTSCLYHSFITLSQGYGEFIHLILKSSLIVSGEETAREGEGEGEGWGVKMSCMVQGKADLTAAACNGSRRGEGN